MEPGPLVSIIIPCRNEARYVERCIRSIIENDLGPYRMEILMVDGMSDDGTREAIAAASAGDSRIRLLDNPGRFLPHAMNVGIRAARGDFVMKVDAHALYPRDYIQKTVSTLIEMGADMAGGTLETRPSADTPSARAVAASLASPWGSLGSRFRTGCNEPREADAAAFGCWRRSLFDEIGSFDERLIRGSDMELNARIRAAGGKIILIPTVQATYFPVSSLRRFVRKNLVDGFWAIYPFAFVRSPVRLRHLAPLIAVVSFVGAAVLSVAWPPLWLGIAAAAGAYLFLTTGVSLDRSVKERDPALFVPLVGAFVIRQWAYGIGSIGGLFRVLTKPAFWSRILRPNSSARAGGHRAARIDASRGGAK